MTHDPNTDFTDRVIDAALNIRRRTMTDAQVSALAAVIAYLEEDEAKDYYQQAPENRASHIYSEILKLIPLVLRDSD